MRKFQVAVPTAAVALVVAVAFGLLFGSWATAKTGRGIPILLDTSSPAAAAKVSFTEGFAPIAKIAVPAVVNVSSSKVVRTPGGGITSDPFFRQFFGGPGEFPPSEEREQSLGSGVIVNADGYILTNNHVVNGAKDVKVLLGDKRRFQAHIVGADPQTDIAVLKVDAKDLPILAFGDSSQMQVGNFVLAIGNPFGLNQTVTMGIVSATGRGGLGIETYEDFIQTDAAINPGNSGGALVDERGDLIGINTAIVSGGSGGNQGVGFAIPGNMARNVMDQLIKSGKVTRAWLGVSIQPVTDDLAKAFHLPQGSGALIASVAKDSPAANAGLKSGDVVLDIDGQKIDDDRALQLKIGQMTPGTTAKFTIFRDGGTHDVQVKLGEMPANEAQAAPRVENPESAHRGIAASNLTPSIARQLGLPSGAKGVVVTGVDPASPAAAAGLQRGDVIEEINHQPISGVAEFNRAMQSAGNEPVLLLFSRSGATSYIVVPAQ